MNTKPETKTNELISCDICMKEVSSDEGHVTEIDDYVMHFCGLECYDKWHKNAAEEKKAEA